MAMDSEASSDSCRVCDILELSSMPKCSARASRVGYCQSNVGDNCRPSQSSRCPERSTVSFESRPRRVKGALGSISEGESPKRVANCSLSQDWISKVRPDDAVLVVHPSDVLGLFSFHSEIVSSSPARYA